MRLPPRTVAFATGLGLATFLAGPAFAATIIGTSGADRLEGTAQADIIRARAGNDRVEARGGNDKVYGGRGSDLIYLGRGADRVVNSRGRDRVYGGPGNDVAHNAYFADLGGGDDRYTMANGRSCLVVHLGTGNDVSPGDPGSWGGTDDCVLRGGPGDDRIRWGGTDAPDASHSSKLFGGPGADIIQGGYNHDTLIGGAGPDQIRADEFNGSDRVFAGKGNDEVFGLDQGGPPVNCGPGVDTVHTSGDRALNDCEIVNPSP